MSYSLNHQRWLGKEIHNHLSYAIVLFFFSLSCSSLYAQSFLEEFSKHPIFKERKAFEKPTVEDLVQLIRKAKINQINVDAADSYGNTALAQAVIFSAIHMEATEAYRIHPVIRALIEAGANINQLIHLQSNEKVPLICGIFMFGTLNSKSLDLLFELGAQTNPNCSGSTLDEFLDTAISPFIADQMRNSLTKARK
jgi:hypothetical protein